MKSFAPIQIQLAAIIAALLCIMTSAMTISCGRGHSPHRERLDSLNRDVETRPDSAMEVLNSIDAKILSEADSHYLDLLKIKAADMCYVTHTSDSLVKKLVEYYSDHADEGLYPEALYYAGRVYSDIGDLPSALDFYQQALHLLPSATTNLPLRGKILSQTCTVLNSLRLYDQAITKLKDLIEFNYVSKDSINVIHDTNLLASIYLNNKQYDLAEKSLIESRKLAEKYAKQELALQDTYLANIKYEKGKIDSALRLIRPVIKNKNSEYRQMALASACLIYLKAEIYDSAAIFAKELIKLDGEPNRRIGYKVLLSQKMGNTINADSLRLYAYDCWNEIESYLNKNGKQEALIRNSIYNYGIHLRDKKIAENKFNNLTNLIFLAIAAVLCLIIYIYYQKYKTKSKLVLLHEAIAKAKSKQIQPEKSTNNDSLLDTTNRQRGLHDESTEFEEGDSTSSNQNKSYLKASELQSELRTIFLDKLHDENFSHIVPSEILESKAYQDIIQRARKEVPVSDSDRVWSSLAKDVLRAYPEFKGRLQLLIGDKLKNSDFNLVLLIKCGISPTDMSTVMGRSKSTISYRRKVLGEKAFGKDLPPSDIDKLIKLI